MKESLSILVVCTGNICRSPTGEAVLRHIVEQRGLAGRIRVASAGTHDYHVGQCPDRRAIRHASRRGYDLDRCWKLAAEILYVPLKVQRDIDGPTERDPLTSLRLRAMYRF